jgi:excisionase family DNA binding protein
VGFFVARPALRRKEPTKVAHKNLYTVKDICETLSLGRTHLYQLIARGEIETVKIGRARRITHEALEAFLRKLQIEQANNVSREDLR